MKNTSIITILLLFAITCSAQKRHFKIKDYSLLIKPTEIAARKFKLKQAKTAYELALNFSYLHHQTSGSKDQFLSLPVILVNDSPSFGEQLKEIKISEIAHYDFKYGTQISAIYGNRSRYGVLTIQLKENG